MAQKVTRVVFTINNYKDEQSVQDWITKNCKYGVYGREEGEKGTPHLQGFIILKNQKRINQVSKALNAHTEPARGTNDQAAEYCKKDEKFWEFGSYPKGRGTRTDIQDYIQAIKEGADDEKLAEDHPACFVKYTRAADKLRKICAEKGKMNDLKEKYKDVTLRIWQRTALRKVKEQDERKVQWIVDEIGNKGKSWFANYLVAMHGAFLIDGGKWSDIAYAYKDEPIVVCDFERDQQERIPYGLIEKFKNGRLFAGKYESTRKWFTPAKVICLSNFYPDTTKLSSDRWDVTTL